jgi:hypothetical protein
MNARIQELEKENQGVNEMKQNIQFLKQKNEELNFKLRNVRTQVPGKSKACYIFLC